jgi:hypothetical protein
MRFLKHPILVAASGILYLLSGARALAGQADVEKVIQEIEAQSVKDIAMFKRQEHLGQVAIVGGYVAGALAIYFVGPIAIRLARGAAIFEPGEVFSVAFLRASRNAKWLGGSYWGLGAVGAPAAGSVVKNISAPKQDPKPALPVAAPAVEAPPAPASVPAG